LWLGYQRADRLTLEQSTATQAPSKRERPVGERGALRYYREERYVFVVYGRAVG
jgi:hypothetical protein